MNYDRWLQSDKAFEEFHGLIPDKCERRRLRDEELVERWERNKEERPHPPDKRGG